MVHETEERTLETDPDELKELQDNAEGVEEMFKSDVKSGYKTLVGAMSLVILSSMAATAWVALDWPIPATRQYVEQKLKAFINPIKSELLMEGVAQRNAELERLWGEQTQLHLQLEKGGTVDPTSYSIIKNRLQRVNTLIDEKAEEIKTRQKKLRRLGLPDEG